VVSMTVMEKAWKLTFTKPSTPLPQYTLSVLSRQLGAGRYVQDGADEILEETVVEVLGTNDYLIRDYRDSHKTSEDPTQTLRLNINYYGSGSSTTHIPENCWAGSGMKEVRRLRSQFEIPDVRRQDGSVVTLRARIVSFRPSGEAENLDRLKNVAYVFNVNGEYVATRHEVLSRFWKASNKYAFNTKIEVTVGDPGEYCSQEDAKAAIAEFFRGSISEIESILPSVRVKSSPAGVGEPVPDAGR